jgi:hypothetical protein
MRARIKRSISLAAIGRLFYMETSAQYREFAEECDRLAKQAKTDDHRLILEMAKAWRVVAAENDCAQA